MSADIVQSVRDHGGIERVENSRRGPIVVCRDGWKRRITPHEGRALLAAGREPQQEPTPCSTS